MLPHFTDCTFQFLNKAVQNQAVNRLKSAGEDFGHHQGGPRAGSWVLGWVSLPWAHHSQDPPGLKDSTDSESLMGTALATGHPAFSSLQPLPKLSTGSGGAWRMLTSAPDTGHTARLGGSQGHPAGLLWCQPLPKHSADPPAPEHRDGKGREALRARRCLHVERETKPEHTAG